VPPIDVPNYRTTAEGFTVDYPPSLDRAYALAHTVTGVSALLRLERDPEARVRLVRSVPDLRAAQRDRDFAAILHFADADAIDPDLDLLHVLHAAGLRSIAVTWSRANAFGHGAPCRSPSTADLGPGLTDAGVRLVRACNALGILVDLAHLNERGFWDVARHSTAPLVVTHGAAHALSPTSRALSDRQLRAVAESRGLVGVSLEGPEVRAAERTGAMVRQIEYLIETLGIDCVALGTDLYRKATVGQPGVSAQLPGMLQELARAGLGGDDLRRIAFENWMRVFEATWS
jgi:membrane dipeptidase